MVTAQNQPSQFGLKGVDQVFDRLGLQVVVREIDHIRLVVVAHHGLGFNQGLDPVGAENYLLLVPAYDTRRGGLQALVFALIQLGGGLVRLFFEIPVFVIDTVDNSDVSLKV